MRLAVSAVALALVGVPVPAMREPALAVRAPGGWETWWRGDSAPQKWSAALPAVADRVEWRAASPGVEWGEFSLSGEGEAFRVRVIVARLDPALLEFKLVKPEDGKVFAGRWSVSDAPGEAVFAVNAGQFSDQPWGWVVQDGVERQVPGRGPLAPGIVVDAGGAVRLVPPDSLAVIRPETRVAFQSYPTLLANDGEIPLALRVDGMGVDRTHRDARLALGVERDGRVLVALTRFEGLGGVLSNVPLGLTTPEMAAVMGALGASSAVLLDGGISSQMLIRAPAGVQVWSGWRKVALGLVAVPR